MAKSNSSQGHVDVSGFHSILEHIKTCPQNVLSIQVPKGQTPGFSPGRLNEVVGLAKRHQIPVEVSKTSELTAKVRSFTYDDFSEFVQFHGEHASAKSLVIALDGITDPHNFGAIIRSAAFMGVDAIIIPQDRSVSINPVVFKIASGGVSHSSIIQVTNLPQSLEGLKSAGYWIAGLSEHAEQSLQSLVPSEKLVVVIGNEETGLRPLVQKRCDYFLSLPAHGPIKSLNASVAASLALAWAKDFFRR